LIETFAKSQLLSELSTWGIGGLARYYKAVTTIEEMTFLLAYCAKVKLPHLVIGRGSNCLFDSRGFDGLIIHNKIDFCNDLGEGRFHAGAGFHFSLLGTQTARKGWSGLEFASGIPGSVGGAVFMNAGANGRETCDALESVEWIDPQGRLQCFDVDQLDFSYRHSSFHDMGGAIVAATFNLIPIATARQDQIAIIQYRTKTQPYGDKSAGCVFRNPTVKEGAGSLIERSGLKGVAVGGAQVSLKHANFIVNKEGASSEDVHALIALVKERVKERCGVELWEEIRYIPYQVRGHDA